MRTPPPATIIYLSPGGSTGAASISYIKLCSEQQKHAQTLNFPSVYELYKQKQWTVVSTPATVVGKVIRQKLN